MRERLAARRYPNREADSGPRPRPPEQAPSSCGESTARSDPVWLAVSDWWFVEPTTFTTNPNHQLRDRCCVRGTKDTIISAGNGLSDADLVQKGADIDRCRYRRRLDLGAAAIVA